MALVHAHSTIHFAGENFKARPPRMGKSFLMRRHGYANSCQLTSNNNFNCQTANGSILAVIAKWARSLLPFPFFLILYMYFFLSLPLSFSLFYINISKKLTHSTCCSWGKAEIKKFWNIMLTKGDTFRPHFIPILYFSHLFSFNFLWNSQLGRGPQNQKP